jgi:hypothetical protein
LAVQALPAFWARTTIARREYSTVCEIMGALPWETNVELRNAEAGDLEHTVESEASQK